MTKAFPAGLPQIGASSEMVLNYGAQLPRLVIEEIAATPSPPQLFRSRLMYHRRDAVLSRASKPIRSQAGVDSSSSQRFTERDCWAETQLVGAGRN